MTPLRGLRLIRTVLLSYAQSFLVRSWVVDFDLIFMWLAFPFGWSASPGYFQACAGLIAFLHCLHRPVSPIDGFHTFASHMFVGDAMIIDVALPARLDRSARAWGHCFESVSDTGSVSDRQKMVERTWEEGRISGVSCECRNQADYASRLQH